MSPCVEHVGSVSRDGYGPRAMSGVPTEDFEMPPTKMSGGKRAQYGCILSFENADGLTLVLHRAGPPMTKALEMIAAALALDPTFKLTAYSTPSTVYTDLQGSREVSGWNQAGRDPLPETKLLARLGRLDLLHPRLHGSYAPASRFTRRERMA